VLLTEAGRSLLERARGVLLEAEDLLAAARAAADPLAGTLRIGVIPTVSPYLLPSLAPRLRDLFPQLRPLWVEEKTQLLLALLAEGRLEAVLLARVEELREFAHEVVGEDPFRLAARRDHPLGRTSRKAALSDLRQAEVLLLEEGHCMRQHALEFCARARARELEFRATSLATLVQMVAAGAGVTLLPELSLATEAARAPQLRLRRFVAPVPSRTIVLAWRKGSPLQDALSRVAAAMKQAYPLRAPTTAAR
jgi:LysR family hydrogen peroxide-inducible transcriptional activator